MSLNQSPSEPPKLILWEIASDLLILVSGLAIGFVIGTLHGVGGVWLLLLGILGRFIISNMIIAPIFKSESRVMQILIKRSDPVVIALYRHALAYANGLHTTRSARTCTEGNCVIIP